MRPLRLRVKGFTAFREEQVLDLEGLDVFAICGPTGSGSGHGLVGMAERARLVGGTCTTGGTATGGFRVEAMLPMGET